MQFLSSTFRDHYYDFKLKLVYLVFCYLLLLFLFYLYADQILFLFLSPIADYINSNTFFFYKINDLFIIILKISGVVAVCAIFPVSLYFIYLYLVPGLIYSEKRKLVVLLFVPTFIIHFISLVLFFYVFISIYDFFLSFEISNHNTFLNFKFFAEITKHIKLFFLIGINFILYFQILLLLLAFYCRPFLTLLCTKRVVFYLFLFGWVLILGSAFFFEQILLFFILVFLYEFTIFLYLVCFLYSLDT